MFLLCCCTVAVLSLYRRCVIAVQRSLVLVAFDAWFQRAERVLRVATHSLQTTTINHATTSTPTIIWSTAPLDRELENHHTTGVHLMSKGDSHGQQYNTPYNVVVNRGADVIIVGRGITESENPVEVLVVWCGVVWCGMVWCGVVWCGVVWCGVVWCGVVWCSVV